MGTSYIQKSKPLKMPTVTTTITSAAASGTCTTVTTTEATPDSSSSHPNVAFVGSCLAAWGRGELTTAEGCRQWITEDAVWSFVNAAAFTNTDIIRDYIGPAGLAEGCNNIASHGIDLGDPATWKFAANEDYVDVRIPNHSFGLTSTGKYTPADGTPAGYHFVTFSVNGSGDKLTGCHHNVPVGLNDCFDSPLSLVESMIGAWGAGELMDNAKLTKYFSADSVIDGGSSTAPGFQQYDFGGFQRHLTEMALYDFNDMTWDFYPCPFGVTAIWTISSLSRKDTGKATPPTKGINLFTVEGGKITKAQIIFNTIADVEALWA